MPKNYENPDDESGCHTVTGRSMCDSVNPALAATK